MVVPRTLVRKIVSIIEDYEIVVDRHSKPTQDGRWIKAYIFWDTHKIVVYLKNNGSFAEMVMSVIHEWIHAAKEDLPEDWVDEVLDRSAFTSPKLRWLAAEKLGDALMTSRVG